MSGSALCPAAGKSNGCAVFPRSLLLKTGYFLRDSKRTIPLQVSIRFCISRCQRRYTDLRLPYWDASCLAEVFGAKGIDILSSKKSEFFIFFRLQDGRNGFIPVYTGVGEGCLDGGFLAVNGCWCVLGRCCLGCSRCC